MMKYDGGRVVMLKTGLLCICHRGRGVLWGHATKHFAAFDLPTFTQGSFANLQTWPDPDLQLSSQH